MRLVKQGVKGKPWAGHPLEWRRMKNKSDGSASVMMSCDKGHLASLTDHAIKPDGHVQPSVECPEDGCGFHDYVKLQGWADAA